MSQRKLFGTDGIRGRANVYPMTGEIAFALGRAVTAHFQKQSHNKVPIIILGKDTRLSCYMLEQAFSSGVCAQGGRVILTGPLPTPGVAFVTQSMRADVGIMISASHNPFYDNGIKIFDKTGHKLPDQVELELEKMTLSPELIPKKLGGDLGRAKRLDEVVGRYIVKVKQALSSDQSLEGMRLVVDAANGASYKVAPQAFQELGAEVVAIGNQPNGQNINENVGALHPENCADYVKKYRADLGICLDGDGDRLVIVDNLGNVLDGDQLIGVLAKFLIETNQIGENKEVVGTVMSNLGLENYVKSLGGQFYRTKVGDRYIVERMLSAKSNFGGEPSGHLIFKNISTTGDGILAALKVIECLKYYNRPLEELASEVTLYPQKLINIKVAQKIPFDQVNGLQQQVLACEKKMGTKGRVLLRYSGTENLARVMVEGEDAELVLEQAKTLAAYIEKEIGL